MAGNSQASNFKASELLDAVERLDSNKNGVTLEELRKTSRYYSERLMDNLRSAAAELRTEKNPNPEKVAALRSSIERLGALNGLKASQEQEIKALYNGEMKDFYELFAELKTRLESLKAEVSAPKADKAPGAETVVVADAKAAKPAAAAAETVVVARDAKPAAPKSETKEALTGFAAKREFLLADDSVFQNVKGERVSTYGKQQLRDLFSRPQIVANEVEFDRLVLRLAGEPLNIQDEKGANAVRQKFHENLSLRLRTFSELFNRTIGEKFDMKGNGGLISIIRGEEGELVKRLVRISEGLEKSPDAKNGGITMEEIATGLARMGLGMLLGPIYLDIRKKNGVGHEGAKEGKDDGIGLAVRSSDSKVNVEGRVAPVLLFGKIPLGVALEGNFNGNDREAEIVGKVREAAKIYDTAIDSETGKMDETKTPNPENARAFNRTVDSMRTGDAAKDKILYKAVRDACLLQFADNLTRADLGLELKGIGAGVILTFLPPFVVPFAKVNVQHLSAKIREGKVDMASAADARTLGESDHAKYGIVLSQVGETYEYRIDLSKGYKIDNRTGLAFENGVIKSGKPLHFGHFIVVSDSLKDGESAPEILAISSIPLGAEANVTTGAKPRESIYVAASNDKLRNEVMNAMKGITSRNVRERPTGFPALQEAIAKAYASGNPEGAYKLLSHVKIEGKKPLAALAAAHAKDKPEDKRELLNMVLQETAGDWRIRNFDAIKTDAKAFKDFVERTGYKGTQKELKLGHVDSAWNLGGTFDKNLLAKTGLGKEKDQKEALVALGKARAEYSKELGKLDSINNNTREIKNAIGFVNFHQVAIGADGKSYKRFQEVVPVAGTVKAVNVEPTKFESAAMRRQLVSEIPTFVLESLRTTINEQTKKAGTAEIGSIDDVRKLLLNNGSKTEGAFRPDIQLTSDLAYTRFAKCLNDTYLIQNINLCVTGPNGQTTCAPTIPKVLSQIIAPVGESETSALDVGIGISGGLKRKNDNKGGDNPNNPNNNTTTPGVTPVAPTVPVVTPPSVPVAF